MDRLMVGIDDFDAEIIKSCEFNYYRKDEDTLRIYKEKCKNIIPKDNGRIFCDNHYGSTGSDDGSEDSIESIEMISNLFVKSIRKMLSYFSGRIS